MIVALALIGALFTVDHAEFLNQVEKNKADGMSWHYIGSTAPNANDPYIAAINKETGEETVYFKMLQD